MSILMELFFTFVKIGLFTFGGGYAMISMIENNCVEKKAWITHDEMMDVTVIAESTPGPIAINCSTFIGYKKMGLVGAIIATLGMCIPSFVIIYLISLFFNQFLAFSAVASAFKGIQVCVVFLIFSAGFKMLRKIKKNAFNITVMALTFAAMVTFSLFSVSFSSIFYILIFGLIGLLIYTVGYLRDKNQGEEEKK